MAAARPQTSEFTLDEYFAKDIHINLHLFSMHLRTVKGTWDYPSHEHFQYEINYLIKGQQSFTVNGKTYLQQANDILLIQPGQTHFSRSFNGECFTYFCMHFQIDDTHLLPILNRSKPNFYPSLTPMAERMRPHLDRLIDFAKRSSTLHIHERMQMHAELFLLFGSISEMILQQESEQPERPEEVGLAIHIADRIAQLVKNSHFHGNGQQLERTGIDDIADHFGISVSYCNRLFKKHFQQSPRQYLSAMMLQKAKHLLMQQELPIDHVAELLGYRELANFSRQFKRWTGISPLSYRQSHTAD